MVNPKQTTEFLLGEISSEVKDIKRHVDTQNGSLEKVKSSLNGVSDKIGLLPCAVRGEQIDNLLEQAEKKAKEFNNEMSDRKRTRRDLFIALVAALVTGGFTLIGVLLARGIW